jgi:hypothetical protein
VDVLDLHLDRRDLHLGPLRVRHVQRPHPVRVGQGRLGAVPIVLPWLGAFVYLIARGKSMNDRQVAAQAHAKAQQDAYIQQAASGSSDPTAQIASAKSLMDSGAISEAEYQARKAKALS